MAKLTTKQQRFVEEYQLDGNATQAAIRAGYSKKTAHRSGAQNMQKREIQAALMELTKRRSERTGIDADWLLTRLADEATADLNDLYQENGQIKPIAEWPDIWRQGLVQGIEVETLGREGEDAIIARVTKIKVSDRIKRLELIGKHIDVQAFQDRVQHDLATVDFKDLTGAPADSV